MTGKQRSNFSFVLLIFKESLRSFKKNGNLDTSASLAYYGFFAFIPLFFIVLSLLSIRSTPLHLLIDGIEHVTGQIFPRFGKVITDEVYLLAKHRNAIGIFGFAALAWSITPLINAARNAFATIFAVKKKISFLKSIIVDIIALSVIILLFAALVTSELYYETIIKNTLIQSPFTASIIDYVIPFIITFLSVLFFYAIFSPLRLKISHLVSASFLVSLFWISMKELFSGFLIVNPHYGIAFGSLRAIFTLIVWSFLSFCILLFGAEIMANMRNKEVILLKKILFKRRVSKSINKEIMERFAKNYNKGEIIYDRGEGANNMFYILSGKVEVNEGEKAASTIGEGAYFGALSMFLEEPRTDSALALTDDTRLVLISRDNFETIVRGHPMIVFDVLKNMALAMKTCC